ncbi:MAG: MFS transporter [Alicyclobacillus sp.]|nr:MFS transporter [Alicyclobacillus sp.]
MKWTFVQELNTFFRIPGSWKLFVAMLAYGCAQGILKPMNAIYLEEHVHLSKLAISILVSISLLTDMCVTLGTGVLSDKVRHKRTLPLIAACLCIGGLMLYLRADNFWTALVSMIVATSPAGIIMGQLFAMARNHFTIEARNIVEIALVWLRAMMSFGFFLGLLLGAQLFTAVSFAGVLYGNLISYALVFLLLLSYRERTAQYEPVQKSAVPFQWLAIIGLLVLLCGDAIRGLYFPLMVNQLFNSPALVSHLWSVQAIFELLWMTVAGYAAARWGTLRMIRIAALCGLLVYFVYSLHPALPWLFAVQPIHSFYVSVLYSVGMGYVQRMFLTRTGFGSSLYLFLSQTASLIGYLTPNLIPGLSPHIFLLPAALVVVSSGLLWVVSLRDRARAAQGLPISG